MTKRILLFFEILIACLLLTGPVLSQDCTTTISLGSLSLERNVKTFTLPISFANPCSVIGIQVGIMTDPLGIITPIMADTTGSRIAGWEHFSYGNPPEDPDLFNVLAYTTCDTPPLEPGDGLLFNMTLQFECGWEDNMTVDVVMGPVFITDPDFDDYPVIIENGAVEIGESTASRGDASCNSILDIGDIMYLVSYFMGSVGCPCTFCAGDCNSDGSIGLGDVLYLVSYFRGAVDPPGPCDE